MFAGSACPAKSQPIAPKEYTIQHRKRVVLHSSELLLLLLPRQRT